MHVLILGASARSAAFSARRAGLRPIAADLFADRDLREIGPAYRISPASYPEGLADVADAVPPHTPWIYTGALENHPALVERIARRRPLWGNDGPTLRAVRDPTALSALFGRAGLSCPGTRDDPRGLPRDGSWLIKPMASAGGQGIVPLVAGNEGSIAVPCYYQERIEGRSLSALFVASRGAATLAGITRQWVGRRGAPFGYVGSLGPWPVAPRVRARIEAIGGALAEGFGLVGLFGVDMILRDAVPWPLEVNPRYTASAEVLELALGRALLADHIRACDPSALSAVDAVPPPPRPRTSALGKLILFAPSRCRFPGLEDPARIGIDDDPFAFRNVGDVPDVGTWFEPGEPVLTLFARGRNVADCRLRLLRRRARWARRLLRWS